MNLSASATDPDPAVAAAGFQFSWTVTGPNTSLTLSSTTASPGISFTPQYGGAYVVALTATDSHQLVSTPVSATINAANVAPTVSISGAPGGVVAVNAGTVVNLSASATDPSTAVAAAGYVYAWHVTGPGTNLNLSSTTASPGISFTPASAGSYAVTLTATDNLNHLASARHRPRSPSRPRMSRPRSPSSTCLRAIPPPSARP